MLCFTQLWVKPKPENFCLPDWKPNTISPNSDTTSCNSSPERCEGATSFSTLPKKNPFCSFCTCDLLARNNGDSQKKKLYLHLLSWMPCCFLYSIDILVFHVCFNDKPFHKLKIIDSPHQSCPHKRIMFSRYIISQNSRGPQLRQVINQRSKTNIYIPA